MTTPISPAPIDSNEESPVLLNGCDILTILRALRDMRHNVHKDHSISFDSRIQEIADINETLAKIITEARTRFPNDLALTQYI